MLKTKERGCRSGKKGYVTEYIEIDQKLKWWHRRTGKQL